MNRFLILLSVLSLSIASITAIERNKRQNQPDEGRAEYEIDDSAISWTPTTQSTRTTQPINYQSMESSHRNLYSPRASASNYAQSQYGQNHGKSGSLSSEDNGEYREYREEAENEKDKKPGRLELLLKDSKFDCSGKKDGYYADNSVNCQVFHYCVGGAKHSWMCPENTVFHQVHLNCVPSSQDICSQSEKFYMVNDYLHKEMEDKGPNNTVRYYQRYYPEEFIGDAPSVEQIYQNSANQGNRQNNAYHHDNNNNNNYDDNGGNDYRSYNTPAVKPAATYKPHSKPTYKSQTSQSPVRSSYGSNYDRHPTYSDSKEKTSDQSNYYKQSTQSRPPAAKQGNYPAGFTNFPANNSPNFASSNVYKPTQSANNNQQSKPFDFSGITYDDY